MVMITVLLISLLYPSSVKFKYEFQKGQVWRYEDLVAPFDFAIKKTQEELEEDKAEIARRKLVRRSHFMTIVSAWIITVPAAALLSGLLFLPLAAVLK